MAAYGLFVLWRVRACEKVVEWEAADECEVDDLEEPAVDCSLSFAGGGGVSTLLGFSELPSDDDDGAHGSSRVAGIPSTSVGGRLDTSCFSSSTPWCV